MAVPALPGLGCTQGLAAFRTNWINGTDEVFEPVMGDPRFGGWDVAPAFFVKQKYRLRSAAFSEELKKLAIELCSQRKFRNLPPTS
jgi:hypothetical protein